MSTNARGWTESQLRAAVGACTTWRDVARTLGLRPTSTHNLRRHVARLGLDVSHFTGRRRWTEQRLREAVVQAATWPEVAAQLGVPASSHNLLRARAEARRLALDISHLSAPPSAPPEPPALSRSAQPGWLRDAATSIAIAWFSLRGYPTALPTEPQPFDLLVMLPQGVSRVQVKSSVCQVAGGHWQVKVGRRPYSMDKSAGQAPYDPDSFDYYFMVTGDGALYLVPAQVLAGRSRIYADSYSAYCIGDASSLLAWRE